MKTIEEPRNYCVECENKHEDALKVGVTFEGESVCKLNKTNVPPCDSFKIDKNVKYRIDEWM